MTHTRITAIGGSAAVLLPQDVMEQIGAQVGDEVDVMVADDTVLVRRVVGGEKSTRTLDAIVEDLLKRRADAYRRLAEGAS